jgi:hypothetical protein
MHDKEELFLAQVQEFRRWAATVPVKKQQVLEWECDYPGWNQLFQACTNFIETVDVKKLTQETLDAILFVTTADNGCQLIAATIAAYPEKLLYLAQAALRSSYVDAKWQLAIELGEISVHQSEAEHLLCLFFRDEDEYTRRMALGALAEIGSSQIEALVEQAWASEHEYQRIMALSALHKVGSPQLEKYLALAEIDGREYVVGMAARIRREKLDRY